MATDTLLIFTEDTNNLFFDMASFIPDAHIRSCVLNRINTFYVEPGVYLRKYNEIDIMVPKAYWADNPDLRFVYEFIGSLAVSSRSEFRAEHPYQVVIYNRDSKQQSHGTNTHQLLLTPTMCQTYLR